MIMKINLRSPWDANVAIPFHSSFWPGVCLSIDTLRFPTVSFSHAYLYARARARGCSFRSSYSSSSHSSSSPLVRLIWALFFEHRILFRVLPTSYARALTFSRSIIVFLEYPNAFSYLIAEERTELLKEHGKGDTYFSLIYSYFTQNYNCKNN